MFICTDIPQCFAFTSLTILLYNIISIVLSTAHGFSYSKNQFSQTRIAISIINRLLILSMASNKPVIQHTLAYTDNVIGIQSIYRATAVVNIKEKSNKNICDTVININHLLLYIYFITTSTKRNVCFLCFDVIALPKHSKYGHRVVQRVVQPLVVPLQSPFTLCQFIFIPSLCVTDQQNHSVPPALETAIDQHEHHDHIDVTPQVSQSLAKTLGQVSVVVVYRKLWVR